MKKFFTLISVALMAMSANAQEREIMSVASDEVQALIANSIANPIELSNPNFFIVSQESKVYPVGTKDAGAADVVAADGQPITLKTYIWEYNSANVYLKAVSTPNADAGAEESWQKKGNGSIGEDGTTWAGNEAMNVAGCDPQFLYGVSAKNGNPSNTYKDFYEYNEDGDAVHRVVDAPYWAPGCGWLPEKGCYYTFTVKNDGQLKVALWVNKNLNSNPLYIVDAATKEPLNIADVNIVGFMQNNTFEKDADGNACGTNKYKFTEEYKIVQDVEGATPQNRPFFGYFTFNVKKDATYYIFSSKSQPGIFGYEFLSGGSTGIENVETETNANAPVYSISGQQVPKNYKGLVIKNGKKFINK